MIHLHGELMKARSTVDASLVYAVKGWELKEGDKCEKGSQLRPHIVWFGEEVPLLPLAAEAVAHADVLVVVGTSLQVYPAANLAFCAPSAARRFLIDPNPAQVAGFEVVRKVASSGLSEVGVALGMPCKRMG